jgi:hypothetical protein
VESEENFVENASPAAQAARARARIAEAAELGLTVRINCDRCHMPAVLTDSGFRHAEAPDAAVCFLLFPR